MKRADLQLLHEVLHELAVNGPPEDASSPVLGEGAKCASGAPRPTGRSRAGSWLLAVASSGAYSISLYSGPQYPVVAVVAGVGYDDWYGCRVLRSRGGLTTHDCHWPDFHLRRCA